MKYLKLLILPCLFLSFAQAQTKYSAATLTTFSPSETTKKTGKILPTTPFEIVSQEGDKLIVKITGWYLNGQTQILYFSEGQKINAAVFAKDANNKVEKLESNTINGDTWEKVSITTMISEGEFENSVDTLNKKASDLYQNSCSVCHPTPDIDHFNPSQWPSVAGEMGSRTALSKEEIALLTQFLQKTTKNKN